jgi:hypothetical protein
VGDFLVVAFDTDEVTADISTCCESDGEIGGPWTGWPLDVTAAIYWRIHLATPESFSDRV